MACDPNRARDRLRVPTCWSWATQPCLTSPTRRRLITLRDRALEVAEEVEADRHARAALTPEGVASLTT